MIIKWTVDCLHHFGFDYIVETTETRERPEMRADPRRPARAPSLLPHVRTRRITRKRTVQGFAIKSDTDLRVESVEPLGLAMRLYDITTGTGDFIANGVVSHNCFARPTHKYLDMNAGRDFEKEIVVKVNAPEVLRAQLAKPSWKGEHIAMGTNTDPYQWVEGRYKLMRGHLGGDARRRQPVLDPDQVAAAAARPRPDARVAERTSISANLSIPTLDEEMWRATEPHTPSPRARIEAVAKLNRRRHPDAAS